jgi:hypothetical protein
VYNLIRGAMAEAARRHNVMPRQLSLQGARQTLQAFGAELKRAPAKVAAVLSAAALEAIAHHCVGARPDRAEPRVAKRRPKPYPRMQVPRKPARKRLMIGRSSANGAGLEQPVTDAGVTMLKHALPGLTIWH